MRFTLPGGLAEMADEHEPTAAWLTGLDERIDSVAAQFSLRLGEPFEPGGMTAWVAPATTADGTAVVVKIGRRHVESEYEVEGLRAWDGAGIVRLLDSGRPDEQTDVLLLEPCRPGSSADELPALERDEVVAAILRQLWSVPVDPSRFAPLSQMCAYWLREFDEAVAIQRVGDAGIVRAGMALFAELAADDVPEPALLATDLHAGNVLRAEREPWLAIDPKPFYGDRTFDALQHLLNDADRARADVEGWLTRMAALLDLDRDRLAHWLFARCVVEVRWFEVAADLARRLAR